MERWRGEGKKVNSYPYLFRQSFARAIVVFHPFHRDYIRGIGCMFILRMAERERKRERRRRPRFFAADKVKERARENNYFLLRASSLFCLGHQREFSVYSRWRKSHMHDEYTRTSKNLLTERFQRAFSFSTSIRSVETRTFHCCKRSAHARNRISNLTVCGRRVFSVGPSSDSRDNFRAYATSVFTNNVEIIRSSHIPNLANRFSISYTWYRAGMSFIFSVTRFTNDLAVPQRYKIDFILARAILLKISTRKSFGVWSLLQLFLIKWLFSAFDCSNEPLCVASRARFLRSILYDHNEHIILYFMFVKFYPLIHFESNSRKFDCSRPLLAAVLQFPAIYLFNIPRPSLSNENA